MVSFPSQLLLLFAVARGIFIKGGEMIGGPLNPSLNSTLVSMMKPLTLTSYSSPWLIAALPGKVSWPDRRFRVLRP
jgi:hypothetical protein